MSELSDTLARGRAWRQAIMLDACTIVRPGARTYNPSTQTYGQTETHVYSGPCRIVAWRGNEKQAADAEINVYRYRVELPFTADTPVIARRDVATITASVNPWMTGKAIVITEPEIETTATALRVIGEVVT